MSSLLLAFIVFKLQHLQMLLLCWSTLGVTHTHQWSICHSFQWNPLYDCHLPLGWKWHWGFPQAIPSHQRGLCEGPWGTDTSGPPDRCIGHHWMVWSQTCRYWHAQLLSSPIYLWPQVQEYVRTVWPSWVVLVVQLSAEAACNLTQRQIERINGPTD